MDAPTMPEGHEIMREFRADMQEIKTDVALLVKSNARLEKQVIGNGRMGLSDKVRELEDLVERMSEIQMRHLREDRNSAEAQRKRETDRTDKLDEIARENRQFKRNVILAALGVILTNLGAWVVFYLNSAG